MNAPALLISNSASKSLDYAQYTDLRTVMPTSLTTSNLPNNHYHTIIMDNDNTNADVTFLFNLMKDSAQLHLLNKPSEQLTSQLVLSGFSSPIKQEAYYLVKKPTYQQGYSNKLNFVINEDDLLDEDDFVKPSYTNIIEEDKGCSTKKRACKNCSCGRLELENQNIKNIESKCGSCYLGDAFRCSSCPYLGMPSFNKGDKIMLKDSFMEDDI